MVNGHAILSPSSSHCWLNCVAAPFMQKDIPNKGSSYADEGSLAHALAAHCLNNDLRAQDFIGLPFAWELNGKDEVSTITDEMARYIDTLYVDEVRKAAVGKVLLIEQRMPISQITGEPGAEGTGDNIILDDDTLEIGDLKYGIKYRVDAARNEQLMHYAKAAVDMFDWFANFSKIRIKIYQIRLSDKPFVWECTRGELESFISYVSGRAALCRHIMENGLDPDDDANAPYFHADEETCRFCRRSGNCPQQTKRVMELIASDFDDLSQAEPVVNRETEKINNSQPGERLSKAVKAIPFLKLFIKSVEAKVHSSLMNGIDVPGLKLVLGRAGNSTYTDEDLAAKTMKAAGIDDDTIYDKSVISPATAKKKFAKTNKKLWDALDAIIHRPPGKPNVVSAEDPRPAYIPDNVEDDFSASEPDED